MLRMFNLLESCIIQYFITSYMPATSPTRLFSIIKDCSTEGLVGAILAACIGLPVSADPGRLLVELNKFEVGESDGCRAFFLFRNDTVNSFEGFEMSLAILDEVGLAGMEQRLPSQGVRIVRTEGRRQVLQRQAPQQTLSS